MDKQTKATKITDIKREWHLVDLKGKILGREATNIAMILTGKSKPYFVRNLDCGDYVVVINAKEIKVTGKKESLKTYYRHSGYPGGFKAEKLMDLRKRRPGEIIKGAVKGMLPQNKLRDKMLNRLFIFSGDEHRYKDKFSAKGGSALG
jgi:large subunit ribosomal protein L13